MNTTSKLFVGTLIFLAGTSAAIAQAVPPVGLIQTCLAIAATGDDGPTDVQRADDLLRQARKAMAEHNRQLADSFIARAEEINPKYGLFHTGDTPKKCRADYNRSLGLNPDGTSVSAISPVSLGKAQDPFLGHGANARPAGSSDMAYVSPSGSPDGFSSPAQSAPSNAAPPQFTPADPNAALPQSSGYPSTGMATINLPNQNSRPGVRFRRSIGAPSGGVARAQSDALIARRSQGIGRGRRSPCRKPVGASESNRRRLRTDGR